jgi:hypothetical protein
MQALQKKDIPRLIDRLKALGYANRRRVRMYGEMLELVSDPQPQADGFVVDTVSGGKARQVKIPASLVELVKSRGRLAKAA